MTGVQTCALPILNQIAGLATLLAGSGGSTGLVDQLFGDTGLLKSLQNYFPTTNYGATGDLSASSSAYDPNATYTGTYDPVANAGSGTTSVGEM